MSVTYSTTAKSARMQAVADLIDGGSSGGKIEILSATSTVLATFTLNDPCGTVSNGVLTFSGFPKTVQASADGTGTQARFRDSSNNTIISGLTVGTTNADILFSSTTFVNGNNTTLNAASITHAA